MMLRRAAGCALFSTAAAAARGEIGVVTVAAKDRLEALRSQLATDQEDLAAFSRCVTSRAGSFVHHLPTYVETTRTVDLRTLALRHLGKRVYASRSGSSRCGATSKLEASPLQRECVKQSR